MSAVKRQDEIRETLREDFSRLPELMALGEPAQPDSHDEVAPLPELPDAAVAPAGGAQANAPSQIGQEQAGAVDQLDLF